MAHYDIYLINGQSNSNGVLSVSNAPVGVFTAGVLNGVKVWNGSAVVDLNVTDIGPTGNGHTWVGAGTSSNGAYAWPHLVLSDMAVKGQNPLVITVTEGGSCLRLANLANGSHNVDVATLAGSHPTTPILHTALVDRYDDCIAFLDGNLDTYTIRGVFWDQGESDADNMHSRLTDLTAKFAAFRSLTGEVNLPIYYCTRPFSGNFQRPYMDEVDFTVAALNANNHCMKLWNGATFDGAHFNAVTMLAIRDWMINAIDGTQPEEEVTLSVPSITGSNYNALAKAVELIAITDETEAEATEYLITNLQSNNLWDEIVALFFMVGNNYALNLKNPNFRNLTLSGASAVAGGLNFDGINDLALTNFRLQDLPNMRDTNFNICAYLAENSVPVGTQGVASWAGANEGRMFAPLSGTMRMYIESSTVLVTNNITDNSGLLDFGVKSELATLHRNGSFLKSAAYAANNHISHALRIGVDFDGNDFLDNVMPLFMYGYGLTDAQIATRYTIVQAALTILGRQV